MDRRLLFGLSIVLALTAFSSVASAQSPGPDDVAHDHEEVPVEEAISFLENAPQRGNSIVCEALGADGDRFPIAPMVGCLIEGGEKQVCDALLGDYPEYYTTLNCVMHPADKAVCEALGEEHFHSKSATDCLVATITG